MSTSIFPARDFCGLELLEKVDHFFNEAELTELRRRYDTVADRETVTDESQGVQLATLQELAQYWATDYDRRKCEAKLNALPQFITEIDGLRVFSKAHH